MNTIDKILQPLTGYLNSIVRNTVDGWYELEIGIPKNWVYNQNKTISVVLISESDIGKLLKIIPNNSEIIIDDLINFVLLIIETNKKIAEKEEEFNIRMEKMKSIFENEAKKFYDELDEIKENSFKNLNENFEKNIQNTTEPNIVKPKKIRKIKETTLVTKEVINEKQSESSQI